MGAGRDPAGVPEFTPRRPIVVIGPMAVGKSVIGAELARVLGLEFIDSDQLIVTKHGPVPRIFAAKGEHHFRQLEAKAIAGVLDSPKPKAVVLSLGGGAVLDSGTQQLLARATVIFLRAEIDTVRERITRNTGRPLLAADPVGTWQRLAAARGPVYARLADITLDVSRSNVPQLVGRLIEQLAEASRKENLQP
ncbi:shikimate kinase [Arthrobacter sp. H35-D1]|uniref:shikimate kinase n=1 Tax=Arthrobacter sp. H35-D1 TaxID=3046202 RepID=UPI0024BB5A7D|nr:shikimate kinase [Arthrobacter sp. H35-D1]MDJ0313369.1 shikimate kinase [Arthrobacter sp. H35-D1]